MINQSDIQEILKGYDLSRITIAALGGHSALDVCHGAKKHGFRTVVVAQKGREKTFTEYYRTRDERGCVDEVILVDKFSDVLNEDAQARLRELNTIFIHNRYFWVYFNDFARVENDFKVPIFGLRQGVKLEERDVEKNQYYLLEKAGIRLPRLYSSPAEIDKLAIVKVNEAQRGYERAFFFADSEKAFNEEAGKRLDAGLITQETLDKAVIEEYVVGAHVNLNFFYSVMSGYVELMGTDTRRQTNLDGFLRLPASEQGLVRKYMEPSMIETGHYAVTMKESLVEKAYELGEKFVRVMNDEVPPGMIGAFALQGVVAAEEGREEFVIFDVSMRIPGSPGTKFTPYSGYLHGENLSYGERIAMEVYEALDKGELGKILT